MSTIKSSAEHLTLNADGSGNDIKFQSNGSEVASISDGGVVTATSFAGSGANLTNLPAASQLDHSGTKKIEAIAQGVLLPNNQEIRFDDNGGNERTAVMYDSSNTLSVGTSTGNLDLIGGGSYSAIMRISGSNKHGTYSNTGSQPSNEGVWHVENNNNSCCMHVNNSKSSGYGDNILRLQSSQDTGNGSFNILNCRNGGGAVLRIEDSGNVKNSNNSYGSISDERIKQDIADASSQWEDIKAVKVRKYKLKKLVNRDGADNTPYHIGVVAQELESAGISNLVNETKPEKEDVALHADFGTIDSEGVFTEGENVKEVKYSVLYMKSIKALQEAMARIETLEAKVAALEA